MSPRLALALILLVGGCDQETAPVPRARLIVAAGVHRDGGGDPVVSSPPTPAPPTPAPAAPPDVESAWLAGPLVGGCCTEAHGMGPARMAMEDGKVVLHIAEDVPMRCVVELGPTGEPLDLRSCRLAPPWHVLTPKIELHCVTSDHVERCSGHYRVESRIAYDRGGDTVVITRPLAATEPVHDERSSAPTHVDAWLHGTVRFAYPDNSSWHAHVRRDANGALRLDLDTLSNLTTCTLEPGPDGDPAALVGCVPVERRWRPASRPTALHCRHPDDDTARASCRGTMVWRDDARTYDVPVTLSLALR